MNVLEEARLSGKCIFICGNGGSAATACHYIPTMMAVSNDESYDEAFRYPLSVKTEKGDVLIRISGSRNSKNGLNAFEYAKEIGGIVIAIVGYSGGKMKKMADYSIHVDINDMQISEDLQMIFDHMIMYVLSHAHSVGLN